MRAPGGVHRVHHLLAVGGRLHLVALHLEPGPHQQQDRLGVVGDQHPRHLRPRPADAGPVGRRRSPGSRKRKVGALAGRRLDADRPAVQLDQRFRDRQAEAGAADPLGQPGVAAGEALEDVLELLARDSWSVVGHADLHLVTDLASPRPRYDARSGQYSWALVRRLTRTCLIRSASTFTGGRSLSIRSVERLASASVWPRIVRTASSTSWQRLGRHRLDRQPPGVAAGEVEQVVEQADQVAGVVEDDLDRVGLLGGELFALQHQQLGEALDGGQRAAQLVRGGQHELVFHPVEAVAFAGAALQLFGHLVEGGAERRRLREAADRDPGARGRRPPAVPRPRPAPRAAGASRRSGR